jgi:hypothetical protein
MNNTNRRKHGSMQKSVHQQNPASGATQLRVPQVKSNCLGTEKDPGSLGCARDDTKTWPKEKMKQCGVAQMSANRPSSLGSADMDFVAGKT